MDSLICLRLILTVVPESSLMFSKMEQVVITLLFILYEARLVQHMPIPW